MNFEFPTDPRQALEASLTALLLGELPDDQARFLRQAIATDPELAAKYQVTLGLVGDQALAREGLGNRSWTRADSCGRGAGAQIEQSAPRGTVATV